MRGDKDDQDVIPDLSLYDQTTDSIRSEMVLKFSLVLNFIPVKSVSSTKSTAYRNIKNILIAMVFVLHVF